MGIKKRKIDYITLFLLLSGAGIILFFAVVVPNSNVDAFRWLVMEHNYNWQFSDFFRQIVYASDLKNIYFNTHDAPYPPLAMCAFHVLWLLNPIDLPIKLSSWLDLSRYQFNLLLFLMIMITEMLLLYIAIRKILVQFDSWKVNFFFFAILFSAPFFEGAIERGNIALLAIILMLFALHYKDSDNACQRELALLLIAVAAGLKAYPAIFGLLYIREKRWKETIRLIIYGIIFCLLPFVFTGGLGGLAEYIRILKGLSGMMAPRWTSISCFTAAAFQYLGWNTGAQVVAKLLEMLFLAGSIAGAFVEKKNWKRILFLCGIMAVGVPNCYRYTSIFMLIPLIFFLAENREENEKGRSIAFLYTVLFAMTFTIPVWMIRREVDFGIFFPIYLTLLVGIGETAIQKCRRRREGKSEN